MNEQLSRDDFANPADMAQAICGAMSVVRRLKKADRNEFARYDFTSVDDFKDAIRPILAERGLYVRVHQESVDFRDYKDEKGKDKLLAQFEFSMTLCHTSGVQEPPEHMTVALPFTGAQTSGAARSYALKEWFKGKFLMSSGDTNEEADILANANVERLSKADAREVYKQLEQELAQVASANDHKAISVWWSENEYRIEVLPKDWFVSFRAEALSLHKKLKDAAAMDKESEQETGEQFIERAQSWFANSHSGEDLETAFNDLLADAKAHGPDAELQFRAMYKNRLNVIEPNALGAG